MSLFKLREWWSTHQGNGHEEFDQGSLCVANIDNDPDGAEKIITGSFSGVLRIYEPAQAEFLPSDVLLEAQLPEPILEVRAGRFQSGADSCLAVLHPSQLVVYTVRAQGRSGTGVAYLELQKLYSHAIPHTAANMVSGPFGNATEGDYVLVQAYDGQIYIFEHAELVTTTYLPNFLVPGPLAYIPGEDCIVTCTSAFELESYRYASFNAGVTQRQASIARPPERDAKQARTPQPEWSVVLGEFAVDIKTCVRPSSGGEVTDVVVVGEHTLFVVSSMGSIVSQRKLDYHPAAAITYKLPNDSPNVLVATHTSNFVIYSDDRVVWTAKGRTVPVAVRVARIGALEAAVVTLDDEGLLIVCYLGTAPPASVLGLSEGKEVDLETVRARHRELTAAIRSSGSAARPVVADPSEQLVIRTQVPTVVAGMRAFSASQEDFAPRTSPRTSAAQVPHPSCTVRLYLSFAGRGSLTDVRVTAACARPLTVTPECCACPDVVGGTSTPLVVPFEFAADDGATPHDLEAHFAVAYCLENGQPRCGVHTCVLPLSLCAALVPPIKAAAAKLTLVLDRAPPPVVSLFEDLAASSAGEGSQHAQANSVVSLQYPNQQNCTVLVSKSNNKLRVQGSSYEALVTPLQALVARLNTFFSCSGPTSQPATRTTIEEALPLDWFFETIDRHFALRLQKDKLLRELETTAALFRAVQKKVLVRLKDSKPAPLGNMPLLLDETCSKLADLAVHVELVDRSLCSAADKLAAATQLILFCVKCRCPELTDAAFEVLQTHISPNVDDASGMGWEELTDRSTTQLLRGPLARNDKERSVVVLPLEPLKQCDNLKKHLKLVLERVEACSGSLLV